MLLWPLSLEVSGSETYTDVETDVTDTELHNKPDSDIASKSQ